MEGGGDGEVCSGKVRARQRRKEKKRNAQAPWLAVTASTVALKVLYVPMAA